MNQEYRTSDIGFAAYLKMKGYALLGASQSEGNSKRFDFRFTIPSDKVDTERVSFSNSESQKFDSSMRMIKMLIKGSR